MKSMKKTVFAIAVVLVSSFAVFSCQQGDDDLSDLQVDFSGVLDQKAPENGDGGGSNDAP